MFHMPQEVLVVLYAFAPLFSKPVWNHATTLAIGSILSPGKRTVTSALRVMGLREEKRFTNFHRVLNRAKWSSLQGAKKNIPWPSCPFNSRQPAVDHSRR